MKSLLVILTLASALMAVADETAAKTNAADKAAARAERRRLRGTVEQRQFGGYVAKPNSAQGKVVFLNAQKAVSRADLQLALDVIGKTVHPEMSLIDVDSVKLINPKGDILKAGGRIGVVFADSPDLPMMVTAPESGWAIVNVAALKDGKPDGLAHRVRVEALRAFALVCGCSFMTRDPVVLWPHVLISEDLDGLPAEEYGVFARVQMEQQLPLHGVTPWKVMTYEQACREGWAHSPTNKWEQKVWDRVQGIPTKPLKITFDKDQEKPVVK